MPGRITAATLILLFGCSSSGNLFENLTGKSLSYAQYQSLEKGMRAKAIVNAFGSPADTMERDGKIRGLTYRCEDGTGKTRQLRMVFDAGERLSEWVLRMSDGSALPTEEEPKSTS